MQPTQSNAGSVQTRLLAVEHAVLNTFFRDVPDGTRFSLVVRPGQPFPAELPRRKPYLKMTDHELHDKLAVSLYLQLRPFLPILVDSARAHCDGMPLGAVDDPDAPCPEVLVVQAFESAARPQTAQARVNVPVLLELLHDGHGPALKALLSSSSAGVTRLAVTPHFTYPLDGEEVVFTGALRTRIETMIGQPLIESEHERYKAETVLNLPPGIREELSGLMSAAERES